MRPLRIKLPTILGAMSKLLLNPRIETVVQSEYQKCATMSIPQKANFYKLSLAMDCPLCRPVLYCTCKVKQVFIFLGVHMSEVELQQIGQYTITELLHMSSTSHFYQGKLRKKNIVIKRLNTPLTTSEAKEAFLSRAKQLKKLKHRHIVNTLDAGFDGDHGYLVMEHVAGDSLRQRIAQGEHLAPDEVKLLLTPLAETLHYAHVNNTLHSNLHPGNLITGEHNSILLTEFSLLLPDITPLLDDETLAIPYMAPEHLRGQPTFASDQYSLAVMVYEWLCGRRPYAATERELLLQQQEQDMFPPPRSLNEAISPAVERVVVQALAYKAEERFPHTLEFANHYLGALIGFAVKSVAPPIKRVSAPPISQPTTKKEVTTASTINHSPTSGANQDTIDKGIVTGEVQLISNDGVKDKHTEQIASTTPTPFSQEEHDLLNQRYRIIDPNPIGSGGFSSVYKGQDTKLSNRLVAIKKMSQSDLSQKQTEENLEAFKREANLLASLEHTNLPRIHDCFCEEEHWYIVMDFIEGETLENHLMKEKQGYLSVTEVLDIATKLCTVLDYLHNQQPPIIFRDLKPANIMLRPDGQLFLIDFGIARYFKQGQSKDTTPLGTLGYAPPEQFGQEQTSTKSDIYSLGALLHHLLSGHDPSQTPLQFEPLQLGSQQNLQQLGTLIMQMVDRNKENRPESAVIIQQEMQQIASQMSPGQMSIPTTPEKPRLSVGASSRLQAIIAADLCQGGILSQRLPGYEERPAQVEMATLVARSLTQNVPAIVEAGTGTGKALDVDTPIPTPGGWKRMGDLGVGNMVFDEKGHPTRVVAAFDTMYQHPCYEVIFSDGSSLVADAEHEWVSYTATDRKHKWVNQPKTSTYMDKNFVTLDQIAMFDQLIALSHNDDTLSISGAVALIGGHHWSVYQATREIESVNPGKRPAHYPRHRLLTTTRSRLAKDLSEQRRDNRAYTLVTTEQMAATLTVGASKRANHAIAVAGALTLPDVDLPIAPYFFGLWLGDGNSRNNQITTADPDLITEREKDGYTVRSLSNQYLYAVDDENGKAVHRWQPGMTGRLRTLGVRRNKHIPTLYLRASEQQRRALLAGLLDTDGTVSHTGAVEFTNTNQQLVQDMYELVCSLGFRPTLRQGNAKCNGKDCGPKWTISFTTKEQVFRLKRKVIAHKERLRNYSPERNYFRYVVEVREVPSRPVRCIQVDLRVICTLQASP